MRRLIPILLLTISLAPFHTNAQEIQMLTLKESVDYALKNTAAAKNAKLDIMLQKAQNAEVTGRALPQINAQGKYQHYVDPMKSVLPGDFLPGGIPGSSIIIPFSVKHNTNLGITGSQLLFNGSVFVALQARKTLVLLAEQSAAMKEEDIRLNVQKAYMALIIAKKQFNVLLNSMKLVRKGNTDLAITYQEGLIEKLELDRNSVQVSNLESDSLNAANGIEIAEQLLKLNMGMDLNTPIVLTDTNLDNNLADAEKLLLQDAAYENRLSYNVLSTTVKLKKYDLKRYRYEGLPNLSLVGNAAYNFASNQFRDVVNAKYLTSSFYILQLDIPLFDGLQRRNRVKAAKINLEKTLNDLDNTKLGIDFQTKSSKITLSNALQTLESRKRTVNLAMSVFDLSNKKFTAGVGSNQDVILAQSDWLNAQNNYFIALQSVINAQADLQKSLGLLK